MRAHEPASEPAVRPAQPAATGSATLVGGLVMMFLKGANPWFRTPGTY